MVPAADIPASLAEKVAALRRPASYPKPTREVTTVETHMSWVFLTECFAYKLKKPVRLAFLDFSTLALRKYFCDEEIRLNRRLAPEVYLDVVPLTLDAAGTIAVSGTGSPIDWLVKMRRLPADHMLDAAIRRGDYSKRDIERLVDRLAAFYRSAQPVALTPMQYRDRLRADITANLAELKKFAEILPQEEVERVHARQLAFLREHAATLERRVGEGRIVEAHGDLRPEHVLLDPDPQVIDCLEFNPDFRTLDPVDELAFLALECEMQGAPGIGCIVFERYKQVTGDDPGSRLINFYKSYRACLRAKIALWHLRDPEPRKPATWPSLAKRYLTLSGTCAAAFLAPDEATH